MTSKPVIALLVPAALAALAWNVISLRTVTPTWDETIDLDGSDAEEEVAEALAPVERAAIARMLGAQFGGLDERNPFLSAEEAERLGRIGTRLAQPGREPMHPQLDGILFSRTHRVAWLDGQPRSEGDLVRGQRILRIGPDTVTLAAGDSRIQLPLNPLTRETAASEPELLRSGEIDANAE
jgi:hypothetical protein